MGDGGSWIKETFKELTLPNVETIICLDRFHSCKAIHDLIKDPVCYSIALYYLGRSDKRSFLESIKHFIRNKQDEDNYKYLYNNFDEAVNMTKALGPCAMEQVISHHVASQFTSVAKAYSSHNIERYLSSRDNYRNGLNLKKLYIKAKESQTTDREVTVINDYQLDFSIFDKGSDIPYYDTSNIRGKVRFLPVY